MELDIRTKAVIQAVADQRNAATDMVANMAGEIADLREKLETANKKIEELTPKPELTQ